MLCYTSFIPKPSVTVALFSLKAALISPPWVVVGKASVMLEIEVLLFVHLSPSGWWWGKLEIEACLIGPSLPLRVVVVVF